jgi:hypothetical protein
MAELRVITVSDANQVKTTHIIKGSQDHINDLVSSLDTRNELEGGPLYGEENHAK